MKHPEEGGGMIVASIPAYNEEKTIAKVILLAQKYVDKIIVCDDGSSDLTGEIARGLGAAVIQHDRNLGYGAAMKSLFEEARAMEADVMVTLDADGQHNPEDIPKLLKSIQNDEADIVIGSRFLGGADKGIPRYRRVGIKLITKMSNGAIKSKISDAQSGFRAYSKRAIQSLRLQEDGMGVSAEILMKAGRQNLKVREVPIGANYKGIETSTHNPLRHGIAVIAAIFRVIFHEKPLRFLGIPGTILFLLGMTTGLVFYYNYYWASPSRFIPIVFHASVILILIGYLAVFTAACARAEKPLLYLGVPAAVALMIGFMFGFWVLQIFVIEQKIVTNMAVASIALVLIGLFTVSMAITVVRERRRGNRY